jgi:hypothetical protein
MKRIACAVAGLVVLGTAAAVAQPMWGPDRGYWARDRGPAFEDDRPFAGPMRPRRIARIVASLGLDPVGPPVRHGAFIVQPAAADDGRAMRVTINVETGDIVSVTPMTAGPGRAYGAYPSPVPYARVAPDDDEYAPPGPGGRPRADVPSPDPYPPAVIEGPKTGAKSGKAHTEKSAKANPDKTPVPRKRPENAQSATKAEPGMVAPLPLPANPAPVPAQGATPAPAPNNDMPPVAPLE